MTYCYGIACCSGTAAKDALAPLDTTILVRCEILLVSLTPDEGKYPFFTVDNYDYASLLCFFYLIDNVMNH